MASDSQREELHPTPHGLWITTFVGLMLSFGIGAIWSSHAWPLPYGGRADGRIVSVAIAPLPFRPLYLPAVEYEVGGKTYHAAAWLPSFARLTAGEHIVVDYDPGRPEHGMIAYEADALVINLTVAFVFAAGALLFNFVSRRARILESKEALGVDRAL